MEEFLLQLRGFTQKTIEAVLHAQEHAARQGRSSIDTEHLLLGLAATPDALALRFLERFDVTAERISATVLRVAPVAAQPLNVHLLTEGSMSDAARRVLALAREEANVLGCSPSSVSTSYLLLRLLREQTGIAAQCLRQLGINLEAIRPLVAMAPNL